MDVWAAAAAAVAVFLVGQYVLKLVLEPAVAARKSIATARTTFDYYADIWANPPAPQTEASSQQFEASQALRRTAGELRVIPLSVLGYDWVRVPFRLPARDRLERAARNFLGLSNNLFGSSSIALESANRYSDELKAAFGW